MEKQNCIELTLRRWAAWAPGLPNAEAWREWATGRRPIEETGKPDVGFVEPLLRRRLSRVSRMAFQVAATCLAQEPAPGALVFCSRYGEFHRAYDIIRNLCLGGEASAAAFSTSVHNTAVSQFAIHSGDRGPTSVIAGNDATLETACLNAWSTLSAGSLDSILVVYADELLPTLYRGQPTSVHHDFALAFLLVSPHLTRHDDLCLRLSWSERSGAAAEADDEDATLRLVRLCLGGGDDVEIDTGRLSWHWSCTHAAA